MSTQPAASPSASPKVAFISRLAVRFPPQIFSAEIIDRIIDHTIEKCGYYSENYSTLKVCALTAKSWLPRSRYHLYRVVVLRLDIQLTTLAHCLVLRPENSKLVQALQIINLPPNAFLRTKEIPPPPNPPPLIKPKRELNGSVEILQGKLDSEWEPVPPNPLPSFPASERWCHQVPVRLSGFLGELRELHIHNDTIDNLQPTPNSVFSVFGSLRKLVLQSMTFHTIHDFTRLILCFPQLADLHLRINLIWSGALNTSLDDRSVTKTVRVKRPSLTHLTLDLMPPKHRPTAQVLGWLSSASLLASLKSFCCGRDWTMIDEEAPFIGDFIQGLRTVEEISLNIGGLKASAIENVYFEKCTALRRLDLAIGQPDTARLAALVRSLSSIPERNELEMVTLHLGERKESFPTISGWGDLDKLLLSPRFPRLTTLKVICLWRRDEPFGIPSDSLRIFQRKAVEDVVKALPVLHERGKLHVDYERLPSWALRGTSTG